MVESVKRGAMAMDLSAIGGCETFSDCLAERSVGNASAASVDFPPRFRFPMTRAHRAADCF